MLKIKDNVDLKVLEEYGLYSREIYVEEGYDKHDDIYFEYYNKEFVEEILLPLIENGMVEKC